MTLPKYKACCGNRCLNFNCDTREAGGCYCLCRLKDYETTLERQIEGSEHELGGGSVYIPGKLCPPTKSVRKRLEENLKYIKEKIKTYELT